MLFVRARNHVAGSRRKERKCLGPSGTAPLSLLNQQKSHTKEGIQHAIHECINHQKETSSECLCFQSWRGGAVKIYVAGSQEALWRNGTLFHLVRSRFFPLMKAGTFSGKIFFLMASTKAKETKTASKHHRSTLKRHGGLQ